MDARARARFDLEKLLGWDGAKLHVNGFYPQAPVAPTNMRADLGTFSNFDFYDSYSLSSRMVEQGFFDDKKASVRLAACDG